MTPGYARKLRKKRLNWNKTLTTLSAKERPEYVRSSALAGACGQLLNILRKTTRALFIHVRPGGVLARLYAVKDASDGRHHSQMAVFFVYPK